MAKAIPITASCGVSTHLGMKWKLLFWFLVLSGVVYSADVDFDFQRENYSSGETALVKLFFNVELSKDLLLKDANVIDSSGNLISVTKKLVKVNEDEYFFSFILPELDNGTYFVKVGDIYFRKGGVLDKSYFVGGFNVEDKVDVVGFWPGVFFEEILENEQPIFSLNVVNKGESLFDFNLLGVDFFSVSPESFKLNPGSSKNVKVFTNVLGDPSEVFSGDLVLEYDEERYEIPILLKRKGAEVTLKEVVENVTVENITVENVTVENVTIEEFFAEEFLSFIVVEEINVELEADEPRPGDLTLKNYADSDLHDLDVVLTNDLHEIVNLSYGNLSVIPANGELSIHIDINEGRNLTKDYEGYLVVSSEEGYSASLPISVRLPSPEVVPIVNVTNITEPVFEPLEPVAEPVEEKPSYFLWGVLVFLFLVILILIIIFYYKSRKGVSAFEKYVEKIKR